MGRTEEIIGYIIANLSGKITKTQLVKLLYLADMSSVKFTKSQISEIQWIYYRYGPYDLKLDTRLDQLQKEGIIKIMPHNKKNGESYFIFQFTGKSPLPTLEPIKKDIVDTIIKQFGSFTLNQLLESVYKTPPMQAAKKGDLLDLGKMISSSDVAN